MGNRLLNDVYEFHKKYNVPIMDEGSLGFAEDGLIDAKINHIKEETSEIIDAWAKEDIYDFADGIVDLIYVTLGLAIVCGIPFDRVWNEVHTSNMKKVAVERLDQSKRGNRWDVVKPEGWEPPNIEKAFTSAKYPSDNYDFNRIFVLEGPDGCGKTTLAKQMMFLMRGLGLYPYYRHFTYPLWPNVSDYMANIMVDAVNQIKHGPVILDRSFISDMFYSRVFRHNRGIMLEDGMAETLDLLLQRNDVVTVVCLPEFDEYRKNYITKLKDHTEIHTEIAGMDCIYMMYSMLQRSQRVIPYNYKINNIHYITKSMEKHISQHEISIFEYAHYIVNNVSAEELRGNSYGAIGV